MSPTNVDHDETHMPPADPSGIELRYTHSHHWDDLGNPVEVWHVSMDVPDGEDRNGLPAAHHVGDIEILLVNPDDADTEYCLAAQSDHLRAIAFKILDLDNTGSGMHPDLEARIEPLKHFEPAGARLLIINHIKLAPEWRGFGLGILLAALVIERLSRGCRAAISTLVTALSLMPDSAPGSIDPEEVWAQLGFEHFRDGIYVVDLAKSALYEAIDKLRHRLASPATSPD